MESPLHRDMERSEHHGRVHRAVQRAKAFTDGRPVLRALYKGAVALVGGFFVLAGIIMLVTPGPGWVAIFLGLGLWSTEFPWASRLNHRAKGWALYAWRWWSNIVTEWHFQRALKNPPHRLVQGPRHLRTAAPPIGGRT